MDQIPIAAPESSRSAPLSRRAVVGGLATLLVASGLDRVAFAQDASPTPVYAPGVHAEILARTEAVAAPGYYLHVARVTFDPGSKTPPHTHPGDTATYQLSGSTVFTVLAGNALLVRAGTATPATGPAGDPLAVGTNYTIQAGDALLFDADTVHVAANVGDEPAVFWEAALRLVGQPIALPVATPTS